MSIKERISQYLKYKGISDYRFEKDLGLSKGYWNKAKNPSYEILIRICGIYTDISPEWLLTGEGEMFKGNISQTSHGDNSPNIAGNGNNVNTFPILDKALNEITEHRKILAKAQKQMDRLITLLERK